MIKKKRICFFCAFLASLSVISTTVFAGEGSKLYFSSQDGNLYYEPQNTANLDTFLNLKGMTPGATYKDSLEIHNGSSKDYELFFQLVPTDISSPDSAFFLSNIAMKLYYDGEMMFDGKADALSKSTTGIDLSQMTSMGEYKQNATHHITVEITLNKDFWQSSETAIKYYPILSGTGEEKDPYIYGDGQDEKPESGKYEARTYALEEYKSYMAQTSWKFYAENDESVVPINPPKTGDGFQLQYFIIGAIILASIIIIVIVSKHKDRSV